MSVKQIVTLDLPVKSQLRVLTRQGKIDIYVQEDDRGCEECEFRNEEDICKLFECKKIYRMDRKEVVFKKVYGKKE